MSPKNNMDFCPREIFFFRRQLNSYFLFCFDVPVVYGKDQSSGT